MEDTQIIETTEQDPTAVEETIEVEGDETAEETTPTGRKKHAKPILYIDVVDAEGNTESVLAERMWTSAVFPQVPLREFYQYCRDTGQKPTDVTSALIVAAMANIFPEVERTKADRDAQRAAKALPSDEEVLERQEKALAAKMEALQAKMAAVKERAAAVRRGEVIPVAATAPVANGNGAEVDEMEALLNEADTGKVEKKAGKRG